MKGKRERERWRAIASECMKRERVGEKERRESQCKRGIERGLERRRCEEEEETGLEGGREVQLGLGR